MGRKRNPCIDVTYSGEQYEKDRELIARGINPYDNENNFGVEDSDIDEGEKVVSVVVESRTRKRERSVGYNINGHDDARGILDYFSWNERYLRSLVARVTGDSDYADRLDYKGLRRESYKILGVARKIVRRGRDV